MKQFFVECVSCIVLGAIVFGLSKLLRCKANDGSVSKPKRSSIHALVAVGISMSMLFLLMLPQILAATPPTSTHKFHPTFPLASQILVLALYAAPAGIFMFRDKEPLSSIGISRANLWQASAIGIGLSVLTLPSRHGGPVAKPPLSTLAQGLLYYCFVGFGEEFLFRGYLQTRLIAWSGVARGWVVTSVLTALVHLPGRLMQGMGFLDSLVSCASLIPVSLLMGFIMLQTGNLLAPGLVHTFSDWSKVLSGRT